MKIEVYIEGKDPKIVSVSNDEIIKAHCELTNAQIDDIIDINEDDVFRAMLYSPNIVSNFVDDEDIAEFEIKILNYEA